MINRSLTKLIFQEFDLTSMLIREKSIAACLSDIDFSIESFEMK